RPPSGSTRFPYTTLFRSSDAWYMKRLVAVGEAHDFSVQVPVNDLSEDALQKILYGTGTQTYRVQLGSGRYYDSTYEGVIPNLERDRKSTRLNSSHDQISY